MNHPLHRLALASALVLALGAPLLAFELEEPEVPADGAVVPAHVRFFISAEGEWANERYKIELSDDDFDTVLLTLDGTENRKGWAVSFLPPDMDEPPEELVEHRGIYYRLREPLPDGEYTWRAYKYDGTGFERLGRDIAFRVDTTAPAPVSGVRVEAREDGRLELRWDPVYDDEEGGAEQVAGYRIYRFLNKRATQNRPMYLVGESLTTRFLLPKRYDESSILLLLFKVTAIDEAGNEINRAIPHPMGDLQPTDPGLVR